MTGLAGSLKTTSHTIIGLGPQIPLHINNYDEKFSHVSQYKTRNIEIFSIP